MSSMLDIGIQSIHASKVALTVTNQNIANANNPNYTRREIDLVELNYGKYGNGVGIGDIRRIYDQYTNDTLVAANSSFAKSDALYQNAFTFESYIESDASSISKSLNKSLGDLQTLNSDTSSIPGRDLYLSQLHNIVSRFNSTSQEINRLDEYTRKTIGSYVDSVNKSLHDIADINSRLASFNGVDNSEKLPLLDERDKQLNNLAQYINFNQKIDNNGVVSIQLANGTPLVKGTNASSLQAYPASDDTNLTEIGVTIGNMQIKVTSTISGGAVSGLLDFQQQILQEARQEVGRLALVFADNMNEQNKLGMDLYGNLGDNILIDKNDLSLQHGRVVANTNNSGTSAMAVNIGDTNQLTASNYELIFSNSTDYSLVRKSDQQLVDSGTITGFPQSIEVDGFAIDISAGTFLAGDRYNISPTINAASSLTVDMVDSRKLALAFPVVAGAPTSNTGDAKFNITEITDTNNAAFTAMAKTLSPPIRIEFTSDTTYNLIDAGTNTAIESGISYDPTLINPIFPTPGGKDYGYRASLQGLVKSGDKFTIDYNTSGTGDNRNGLILADRYQKGTVQNGSLSYSEGYARITNNLSSKTYISKLNLDTQQILKEQVERRRDQVSGVSLEEEMMNLTKFEQAYMASAQILDVVKDTFNTVIAVLRR